jgi:hypothetical protein
MKEQDKGDVLEGFWPQVDSRDVIKRHSPTKQKIETKSAWDKAEVEEEEDWKIQSPEKTGTDQEERFATIEKTQAEQSTLVTTLTDALGRTRMECNKVLTKANIAIEDSNRAVNALMKHLAALDEEIEAFEKIVTSSESAAKYLEGQVKKIADHLAALTNVPKDEMEAMKKMLAETAAQMKRNKDEGKASKEELKVVRAKRQKAGRESEQAKAKMLAHSIEGEAQRL